MLPGSIGGDRNWTECHLRSIVFAKMFEETFVNARHQWKWYIAWHVFLAVAKVVISMFPVQASKSSQWVVFKNTDVETAPNKTP